MTPLFMPPLFERGHDIADFWNSLVALEGLPVPLGIDGGTLVFQHTSPPAGDAWIASVRAEAATSPVAFAIADFPFHELLGVEIDAAEVTGLPEGLRQALFEGMAAILFQMCALPAPSDGLEMKQGTLSSFSSFTSETTAWFDVSIDLPQDARIRVRAGAERAAIARLLAGHLPQDTSPRGATLAAQLSLPATISIGSLTLRLADLQDLQPGALVVLADEPETRIALQVSNLSFHFTRAETGWACEEIRQAGAFKPDGQPMDPITDLATTNMPDPGETTLEDLEVMLSFDIGSRSVSLATLGRWRSGSIVELDVPDVTNGIEVTLRAGGKVVATGDLVRIDNRAAVRLTRLALHR